MAGTLLSFATSVVGAEVGDSGTMVVDGREVCWKVRGAWEGHLWRYHFKSNRNGTWQTEVEGLKSAQGAKEHGFFQAGAA